jgi:hypothetical protein
MGLLYLAGARGIVLLALAFVVSALASYVLLAKQRDAMSAAMARRFGRPGGPRRRVPGRGWAADFRARLDEGTRAEDEDEDEDASAGIEVPGRLRRP